MTRTAAALVAIVAAIGPAAAARQPAAPAIPDLSGLALTVHGPVDPRTLGQTLMHEHVFIDYKPLVDPTPRFTSAAAATLYERPFTIDTLNAARYGQGLRTRKVIDDYVVTRREVLEFKKWGGRTIVDVSNIGLGRDARALLRLAGDTGLSVVMGAGWYARDYHPREMDQLTLDAMTDTIVRDITVGVDGTAVRAGIIGEIGIAGNPLTDNELKSARASARAARLTGAPMTFHVGGVGEEKFRILDLVAAEGVDLSRVVMGHSNSFITDLPFVRRLLARGVFIEFDYLGLASPPGNPMYQRGDRPIVEGIAALVRAGFADRIVLGHDVCAKQQLKTYGGTGFSYISEYVVPELRRLGVSDSDLGKIMVDNPRRALTFAAPRPAAPRSSAAR